MTELIDFFEFFSKFFWSCFFSYFQGCCVCLQVCLALYQAQEMKKKADYSEILGSLCGSYHKR